MLKTKDHERAAQRRLVKLCEERGGGFMPCSQTLADLVDDADLAQRYQDAAEATLRAGAHLPVDAPDDYVRGWADAMRMLLDHALGHPTALPSRARLEEPHEILRVRRGLASGAGDFDQDARLDMVATRGSGRPDR